MEPRCKQRVSGVRKHKSMQNAALTPGSEAIPEAVYYIYRPRRQSSKQLRGISGTAEGNHGVNLFVA